MTLENHQTQNQILLDAQNFSGLEKYISKAHLILAKL